MNRQPTLMVVPHGDGHGETASARELVKRRQAIDPARLNSLHICFDQLAGLLRESKDPDALFVATVFEQGWTDYQHNRLYFYHDPKTSLRAYYVPTFKAPRHPVIKAWIGMGPAFTQEMFAFVNRENACELNRETVIDYLRVFTTVGHELLHHIDHRLNEDPDKKRSYFREELKGYEIEARTIRALQALYSISDEQLAERYPIERKIVDAWVAFSDAAQELNNTPTSDGLKSRFNTHKASWYDLVLTNEHEAIARMARYDTFLDIAHRIGLNWHDLGCHHRGKPKKTYDAEQIAAMVDNLNEYGRFLTFPLDVSGDQIYSARVLDHLARVDAYYSFYKDFVFRINLICHSTGADETGAVCHVQERVIEFYNGLHDYVQRLEGRNGLKVHFAFDYQRSYYDLNGTIFDSSESMFAEDLDIAICLHFLR